jgi:hypothetical protein
LALKHEDLMTERQKLELQGSSTADDVTNDGEKHDEDSDHRATLA